MSNFKKVLVDKYYNSRAACQVIGSLLDNPKLIHSKELPLSVDDFINPLHKTVFGVVYDLSNNGVGKVTLADIETHLATMSPISHKRFFDSQGDEWIAKVIETSEVENYEHYYWMVRKLSCLRSYMTQGLDVTKLLDYNEFDPTILQQQEERLFAMTMNDIISFFDRKNIEAKKSFVQQSSESGKVGENADLIRQRLKESPAYGFSFESDYLNTIARGLRRGALYIESRDSGTGKENLFR